MSRREILSMPEAFRIVEANQAEERAQGERSVQISQAKTEKLREIGRTESGKILLEQIEARFEAALSALVGASQSDFPSFNEYAVFLIRHQIKMQEAVRIHRQLVKEPTDGNRPVG